MSTLLDPQRKRRFSEEAVRRLKAAFAVLLSLAVLIGGFTFAGMKGWDAWMEFRTAEDYIGEGKQVVEVVIPKGATLADIADLLVESNVVRSAKAFEKEAKGNEKSQSIQAGRYRLKTELPAATALKMLLDPANIVRKKVQVIEGLRLTAQIKVLAEKSGIPEADFQAALKNPAKLGLPKWAKNRPEGFFFPDTYLIEDDETAVGLLRRMTRQFNQVTDDLNFEGRAKDIKRSPYDALIVASIVQAEVSTSAEYAPKVARVLYNRVDKGMKLQLDTTVLYANNKTGKATTTDAERASKNPYNTYVHKGLPPGPITAPGRVALNAAVKPTKGKWLYFVTVNLDTGETLFAETWAQHEANVAKFQAWCQANTGRC